MRWKHGEGVLVGEAACAAPGVPTVAWAPARSLIRGPWAEREPCLVPGVGLYYGEEIHGVPPVLLQMVSRTPVLYEVNIFVTNRFVPIPEVMEAERLLVEQLGVSGFYHVIARCSHMPSHASQLSVAGFYHVIARCVNMPHTPHQTCCGACTPTCRGAAASRQPLLWTGGCVQGSRVIKTWTGSICTPSLH